MKRIINLNGNSVYNIGEERIDAPVMESQTDLLLAYIDPARQGHSAAFEGVFVGAGSRRPARGRSADQIALYLPESSLPGDSGRGMLHLTNLYYKTGGTVTSALRVLADEANRIFLEHGAKSGGDESGVPFCSLVLRHAETAEPLFYTAHSGPLHIFHVTAGTARHLYDAPRSATGLGIHRIAPLLFNQFSLRAGDFLIFYCGAPPGWDASTLRPLHNQGLPAVRRALLALNEGKASGNAPFLLACARTGSGILQVLQPGTEHTVERNAAPQEAPFQAPVTEAKEEPRPAEQPASQAPAVQSAPPVPESPLRREAPAAVPPPPVQEEPGTRLSAGAAPETTGALPQAHAAPRTRIPEAKPAWRAALEEKFQPLRSRLAGLFRRIAPPPQAEGLESPGALPASMMAFIAVAVPVLVVAITSMLYLQRGLTSLNQNYFEQAQSLAVRSISESNLDNRRQILEESRTLLNQAEEYQITTESKSLRNYINSAIDEIEGTVRLNFQPILSGRLPGSADIRRMILVGDDMYLFNAEAGNVLRARREEQTYAIDPEFYCGPGARTGPFVDVTTISWTPPSKSPTISGILGLDARGNLQYCFPEEEKQKIAKTEREAIISHEALVPPDLNWSSPQAVINYGGTLYILDPPANAIWLYDVYEDGRHSGAPVFLFTNKPQIQDATRMVMYRERMFLLHADGRITQCTLDTGFNTPTRCENPAMFTDTVSGAKAGIPQIMHPDGTPVVFSQIIVSPPPDPSLYLLEAPQLSAYHFSLGLALQRRFRAQQDLADVKNAASALVIGNDRTIYMAVGSNIYAAILP